MNDAGHPRWPKEADSTQLDVVNGSVTLVAPGVRLDGTAREQGVDQERGSKGTHTPTQLQQPVNLIMEVTVRALDLITGVAPRSGGAGDITDGVDWTQRPPYSPIGRNTGPSTVMLSKRYPLSTPAPPWTEPITEGRALSP